MKYVVFLGDGMADYPIEALDGKTPLMVAKKINIDALAPKSEIGLAKTVPDGMKPGSDTANLSVMGYDPRTCYSGRSPLEALSMGLTLSETDIAVRCNLVTLSSEEELYADKTMIDYSAGEIDTQESRELISYLEEHLGTERISFHGGISYRHCLIVHDAEVGSDLTPPHDITGKHIKKHLPAGKLGDLFLDLQKQSYELLKDHPINLKRIAEGKNPANSIWLWGEGTKPNIPDFREKNGISGAVISAVDLLKGIGKGANMKVIDVEGATGNVHTDFAAKGRAAIRALSDVDYVYIHVEAPDESGHQGSLTDKITSIERIDEEIVGPVVEYLRASGEPFHVLVCPDHPTPLALRTHVSDPIPYLIYRSDAEQDSGVESYDEESAKVSGIFEEEGFRLIDRLMSAGSSEKKEEGLTPDLITMPESGESIEMKDHEEEALPQEESEEASSEESAPASEESSSEGSTETSQPEKPKKNRFALFFKKHLKLCIILIAVLVLAGGLAAGHLIATYHLGFVHSEEGLYKALQKDRVTTLVFKKDVTVSGDLRLGESVDFDLNEHTLTVEGDLFVPADKDVTIGYKKKGDYLKGGKIVAKKFTVMGSKSLTLYADLEIESAEIECSKSDIRADIAGASAVTSFKVAELSYSGKAAGSFLLTENTSLRFNGDVTAITGGATLELESGNIGTVTGASLVRLYESASVGTVVNVGNYYRVTRLSAPQKLTVLEENGDFYLYVPQVIGATEIRYTVNDVAKDPVAIVPGSHVTKILLRSDDLTPGRQTLKIVLSSDDPRYLDSEEKVISFAFTAKLDTPTVTVTEEGENVSLTFTAVKHASVYRYTINGTAYTTTDLTADITDKTQAGGEYIIEVTAQSDSQYYTDSNAAMTSYVRYVALPDPVLTLTLEDDRLIIVWEKAEGATDYEFLYGETKVYTTLSRVELPYLAEQALTVRAIGGGYHTDSTITLTADEILTAVAPQDESNE